jgi:hypothetical protein
MRPVCTSARSPWPDTRLGVVLASSSVAEAWNHYRENKVGSLVIMLLPQNLLKLVGKGVMTPLERHIVDEGFRDGVLLLQGQEEDMRNQFGHLVSEEKHNREELTIDCGRRSCDPRCTVKEVDNDGDSKGETTARLSGSSRHEESANGGWSQQLAGGECSRGLP